LIDFNKDNKIIIINQEENPQNTHLTFLWFDDKLILL